MRRKEVSKRLRSIAEVRASMAAHADAIGTALAERPAAQGAEALDYRPMFGHLNEELASVERQLVAAEDDHVRQLVRVIELRRQNSEHVAAVYDKQSAARQVLSGIFGSDLKFEVAAVSGATPRVSQTLEEQVDQTTKLLRNPARARPAEKVGGVDIRFEDMASDLEAGLAELQVSRVELQTARKVADGTRKVTNAAIRTVDSVFPWVAGTLENCFRLVGESELADRIRTSARRVSRRQGDDPEANESEEAQSAESNEAEPAASAELVAEDSESAEASA
ncbi:MAG: hypothetical protein AAF657_23675 [Acidobacteriota bacterium]